MLDKRKKKIRGDTNKKRIELERAERSLGIHIRFLGAEERASCSGSLSAGQSAGLVGEGGPQALWTEPSELMFHFRGI